MSKYEKMWEPIYLEFERRHPALADDVIDWYPSGQMEITLRLEDGTKLCYDWILKSVQTVYSPYETIDDISEYEWRMKFADRLTRKMRKFGITQVGLSAKTGISRMTINKYMSGETTPSTYNLHLIAKALRCSPSELLYI